jgi:uncharacterized protein YndB with AHSA1/START domain
VTPLIIRRTLPATPQRIWDAWTRPEVMCRWFYPAPRWSAKVDADVRVGGRYRLEMRDENGQLHVQHGEYRIIEPLSRLVFTWTCEEVGVVDSVVTLELTGKGTQTELVLRHELPEDPNVRKRHEEGWAGCLAQLERLMEE